MVTERSSQHVYVENALLLCTGVRLYVSSVRPCMCVDSVVVPKPFGPRVGNSI